MSKLDDLKKPEIKEETKQTETKEDMLQYIRKLIDEEKQKPKHEYEPLVKPTETKPKEEFKSENLTPEDKENIINETLTKQKKKGIRLRRQEKQMIKNREYDKTENTQLSIIYLTVIGLIFLIVIKNFLPNEAMYSLIILIGSFMFIPVGMLIGWVLLDPVMRCKVLRKVSKRNYGIVNFLGKGNRIISKIKNFDEGLIWQKNDCWALTKDKVYHMTKNGNKINDGKDIDPESVVVLVETVPVIFVDMDSMEPLSIFAKGRESVYPSEIGPACKAWMDNQRAKMMNIKKTGDIFIILVAICCIGAIIVGVLNMGKIDELTQNVNNLKEQINTLLQLPP